MIDLATRTSLAGRLQTEESLVNAVTDAFYQRHPAWAKLYGEAGRRRCREDAKFHLSFLAGAVQAGNTRVFTDYVSWCADMLAARNITAEHLVEHLDLLESHVRFPEPERSVVAPYFEAAREELKQKRSSGAGQEQHTPVQLEYLTAALSGDRHGAWGAASEAISSGIAVSAIYTDVLIWTQRRIGHLWARGEISVAQEHMASAVTQSVVARLYAEIDVERTRGTILLGGVEGELHSLPAQLVADLLELEGWDVAFLGTHVPRKDFITAIDAEQPDVVGLSITTALRLTETAALVRDIRELYPNLRVVLGGRATLGLTDLAAELDVELGDSLDVFARSEDAT